jgi:Tol biopolymer transport system component
VQLEPLPATEGAYYPFWSPDSRFVAFFTGAGKLKKIHIKGGEAQSLCDVPARGGGNGGTWNRNGTILFATYGGPLRRVPDSGGTPQEIFGLDPSRRELSQAWPYFLPNGSDFLYLSLSTDAEKNAICAGSLESKRTRVVMHGLSNASYTEPGFLLYGQEHKLLAQPFDVKKLGAISDAQVILEQVGEMPGFGATLFSISRNGVLAYRTRGGVRTQLSWYDRGGKRLGTIGTPELYESISLSPDEKRVAADRIEPQTRKSNIWVVDLSTGIVSRATFGNDHGSVWSPDSRELAFASFRTGKSALYRKVPGGKEAAILESDEYQYPSAWTADGKLILVTMPTGSTTFSQLLLDGTRKPVALLKSDFDIRDASLSPDGRWIAYDSVQSGRWEVYVASFPSFSQTRQISDAGGVQPLWRKDGKELFYLTRDGKLMAAQINVGTTIETGPPQLLFQTTIDVQAGIRQFSTMRDGQRFLLAEPADPIVDQVVVVINWAAGLKR